MAIPMWWYLFLFIRVMDKAWTQLKTYFQLKPSLQLKFQPSSGGWRNSWGIHLIENEGEGNKRSWASVWVKASRPTVHVLQWGWGIMHCLSADEVRDFAVGSQVKNLIEEVSSTQCNFQTRHHCSYLPMPNEKAVYFGKKSRAFCSLISGEFAERLRRSTESIFVFWFIYAGLRKSEIAFLLSRQDCSLPPSTQYQGCVAGQQSSMALLETQ